MLHEAYILIIVELCSYLEVSYSLYNFAGVAYCNRVRRNIFRHDATSTDGYVITDGYTWQDGHTAANPHIIADDD